MLVELTAGYYETSAAELGWSLRLGPQPALASRLVELPPFRAELRLLGASHQIALWPSDGADPRFTEPLVIEPLLVETVACLPEHTVPLPQTAECELRGWRYTIESDVRTCSAPEFALRVAEIERCATQGLAGRYPGLPGALTAIVIRPWRAGLWWTTWHTYPQDHQIATTLSLLSAQ